MPGRERDGRAARPGAGAGRAVRRPVARPRRASRRRSWCAGDAGIGKTTLVADLAGRAEELGFTVAVGHCLDIEAGISFAAVIEAVAQSGRAGRGPRLTTIARRMQRVAGPRDAAGARSPFRVLEDLRLTVLEAAAAGPVLLVLEDMHWADALDPGLRGSALARTARAGCCSCSPSAATTSIAVTRRARRWPRSAGSPAAGGSTWARWTATASPASWRRSRGAAGSGPGPVRAGPVGGQPAVRRGDRRRRTRGRSPTSCPTCSWRGSTRWPRDRVSCAGSPRWTGRGWTSTRSAERGGPRPTRGWTRSSASCSTRTCCEALGDSLAFRHGLLREAVYDDLLPDERTRLHASLARHPRRPGSTRIRTRVCRC